MLVVGKTRRAFGWCSRGLFLGETFGREALAQALAVSRSESVSAIYHVACTTTQRGVS